MFPPCVAFYMGYMYSYCTYPPLRCYPSIVAALAALFSSSAHTIQYPTCFAPTPIYRIFGCQWQMLLLATVYAIYSSINKAFNPLFTPSNYRLVQGTPDKSNQNLDS